jgi:mannose-6-phosphate isomerase-like protein (cupin superfamily)
MSAQVHRGVGPLDEQAAITTLSADGLSPSAWGNGPNDTYSRHEHHYHKVLYCVSGSITFHTDRGDLALRAGDRLDLPPHTAHAATVGADGVRCVEAPR